MSIKDRAKELLILGINQNLVAETLGCESSYISQLMHDPVFAEEVQTGKFMKQKEATERDGKYDAIEDKLLNKLQEVVDYFIKPKDITDALMKINSAKRRGTSPQEGLVLQQQTVNIMLPPTIKTRFVVSDQNSIVQVGEKELVTMSTDGFKDLLSKRGNSRETVTIENGSS